MILSLVLVGMAGVVAAPSQAIGAVRSLLESPADPAPLDPSRPWLALRYNRDGSPVRWNPCRPVAVQIEPNPVADMRTVDSQVRGALATLAVASGMEFAVGSGSGRGITVVIEDDPTVGDPDAAGWAHSHAEFNIDGIRVYTSGTATVRSKYVDQRYIWLHELLHVLGAAHSPTGGQVMSSPLAAQTDHLMSGDLAAAEALGASAGCLRDP